MISASDPVTGSWTPASAELSKATKYTANGEASSDVDAASRLNHEMATMTTVVPSLATICIAEVNRTEMTSSKK